MSLYMYRILQQYILIIIITIIFIFLLLLLLLSWLLLLSLLLLFPIKSIYLLTYQYLIIEILSTIIINTYTTYTKNVLNYVNISYEIFPKRNIYIYSSSNDAKNQGLSPKWIIASSNQNSTVDSLII